jgi:hypothetical protein
VRARVVGSTEPTRSSRAAAKALCILHTAAS